MSFMFNPYPYDDLSPLNKPHLSEKTQASLTVGNMPVAEVLANDINKKYEKNKETIIVGMDGFATAEWLPLIRLTGDILRRKGFCIELYDISETYHSSDKIEEMLADTLPLDRVNDPVLLFGRLFQGDFSDLLDSKKLKELVKFIIDSQKKKEKKVKFVYGNGSCIKDLRENLNIILYFDVIPKDVVLRIKNGEWKNMGDEGVRTYKEKMRRAYYFDYELCFKMRDELLTGDCIDYYVASSNREELKMLPRESFNEMCEQMVKQPFRCKPVYNEGIWGGYYTKRLRNLPKEMKNCAWVFDLIPLEVSLLIQVGNEFVDIPYFTFVKKEGNALMGDDCVRNFNGYFPVRFNYDDTFHSNGNMSIQVHSGKKYNKETYNEFGSQDEFYYIIDAVHGARTYCGLKDDVDIDVFWRQIKSSEKEATPINYQRYVNSEKSVPGMQFILPAGTIHASGRNQIILEIGSLTVGSYTYKLYDYLRKDFDDNPRPIHSNKGQKALKPDRRTDWVRKNLIQEPRELDRGEGWSEKLIGEHELVYLSLRSIEFEKEAYQDTQGFFHVLVLVNGEQVVVESIENPSLCYQMEYLNMVVVPASLGKYRIRNLGDQPITIHKTRLKDDYESVL